MAQVFYYHKYPVKAIGKGLSLIHISDDDDNYTVGEASDGAYLYTDIVSKTYLPDENQTFTINLRCV